MAAPGGLHTDDLRHDGRSAWRESGDVREAHTQTDHKLQGHVPRLSKVNLFTLLSLWMERFPRREGPENSADDQAVNVSGLVVVRDDQVLGLHCSGRELHAGQAAVVRHGGAGLRGAHLYFSRRPCATCLKMVINAGVDQIFFWPGDPEVSMLRPAGPGPCPSPGPGPDQGLSLSLEARLDAVATGKLRANSRPAVCVVLRPLAPGLARYVDQMSRTSDFMERAREDEPDEDTDELFSRQRAASLKDLSEQFLVVSERQHRAALDAMGLESFCEEPYLSGLRHNMRALVELLASVTAGLPQHRHGFYGTASAGRPDARAPTQAAGPSTEGPPSEAVSQEVARHCILQATLLAYRTEDPKVGVGAVIWAEGQSDVCDGTGRLYLVGCGYNAYPAGSQYAQYPQMDTKSLDRRRSKYRYIVHAEQNAVTFRSREIRAGERSVLFVTKCPCDECVPLIKAAGVTHIYTTDQDSGKDKGEISYLRFQGLQGPAKFVWQKSPVSHNLTNGCIGKRQRRGSHGDQECSNDKRPRRLDATPDLSSSSSHPSPSALWNV